MTIKAIDCPNYGNYFSDSSEISRPPSWKQSQGPAILATLLAPGVLGVLAVGFLVMGSLALSKVAIDRLLPIGMF